MKFAHFAYVFDGFSIFTDSRNYILHTHSIPHRRLAIFNGIISGYIQYNSDEQFAHGLVVANKSLCIVRQANL